MKKIMTICLALLLCAAMLVPAFAEGTPAVSIQLSAETLTLGTGSKVKLEVSTESTEKIKYDWTTSDKKIATVDGKGTVAGVKEGEAVITCNAVLNKEVVATASCTVTVFTSIKSVKAKSPVKNNTLFVKQPTQIETTIAPDNATYTKLVWTSSDESIATVDENGVVTAHQPGKVKITCATDQPNQAKAISANVQFTVKQQVEEISLDATAVVLWEKGSLPDLPDSAEVSMEALPENANDRKVTWETSNKQIADVKNGKITAKNAGGCTVTVRAADGGGTTASCDVIVLNPNTYKINASALDGQGIAFTEDAGKATEYACMMIRAAMERMNEVENPSWFIVINYFARAAAANGQVFMTGVTDDETFPPTVVMSDGQGNIALLSYDSNWGSLYFSKARSFTGEFLQTPVDAAAFGEAIPAMSISAGES